MALVVHPCRTGNPGVVMHAVRVDSDQTKTLCNKEVDADTVGQRWGFRALCNVCYPMQESLVPSFLVEQLVVGREAWPKSSQGVRELDSARVEGLLAQAQYEDGAEPFPPGATA